MSILPIVADDLKTRVARLESVVDGIAQGALEERAAFLVVSGDMERVHTALMLAHAAIALGLDTEIYFAQWGVQALRRQRVAKPRTFIGRCLAWFLARDIGALPSSRLNFFGIGPWLFARVMHSKSIETGVDLLRMAPEAGVQLFACPTSLHLFEIFEEELISDVEIRGAAAFLASASNAQYSGVF